MAEPGAEEPVAEEPAVPVDDAAPADATLEAPATDDKPFDDEPFDAGVEADEETDPKKFIQQLTGKLGQSLRKYTEEQGQPDFELEKFAINSLLSATHTGEMDAKDQKDIISKVKKSGVGDEEGPAEETPADTEAPSEEAPSEEPANDLDFGGEEEIEENMFIDNPKKLSIFAPEGSEEAEYQNTHKHMQKESNNYMFWQNLKTIHHAAGELLKMNYDEVDALLSDGHGWALDHLATSADDVEEVYHFIEGRLNDYHVDSDDQYEMEDEWSTPMELHKEMVVSDDLKYHIENEIPLNETIYRVGSEKYFNLIKEVKSLYSKGFIKLNENDAFIVDEFDNQYIMLEGKKIKMNFIYEDVDDFDFVKSAIQSASGDKVEKRDEDDYGRPLYWSLTNDNVHYFIGDDDNGEKVIVLYNAETGEIYPIGNLKHYDTDINEINEAEYKGKKVQLGKPKRGGSKKFYVYVRDPQSGNIKKVSFGAKSGGGNLAVKLRDPKARKAFSDRHNCPSKTDRTSLGYWACRLPRYAKSLGLAGGGTWW